MALGSKGHFKMAVASIRHNRARSVLTMLGIMIGVLSVILVIAIGEGIKQQIRTNSAYLGNDVITIQPAQSESFLQAAQTTLTTDDAAAVAKLPQIDATVPLAAISGTIDARETKGGQATIIAAGEDAHELFDELIEFGGFSGGEAAETSVAVVGTNVASRIFKEQVPLGQAFSIRGQRFIVQGVLKDIAATPLSPTADLNDAVIIPLETAQKMTGDKAAVYQILARAANTDDSSAAVEAVQATLTRTHGGQQDFTILAPGESGTTNDRALSLITYAVAAIAAISLLVGGIGIMNVMLVSVTERLNEIGVRKAIGATDRQILAQFMIEAAVLSVLGGLAGIVAAVSADGVLRLFSDFRPVISWQVALGAFLVSLIIGLVFGSAPAVKASRKDPIDALRTS